MVALAVACGQAGFDDPPDYALQTEQVWAAALHSAGNSSPRLFDVNGDGVLDVVLGLGVENKYGAVLALDGATGSEIWRADFGDEVYSTPCTVFIDDDTVPDVVVGRRKAFGGVSAHSGRTGQRLWGLRESNPDVEFPRLHFNTSVPGPDLDDDGTPELICLQGGGDDYTRHPAWLYVVSGATGVILSSLETPDGAESYFVPAIERVVDTGGWRLLVGTGGETLPGHLMSLEFPSLTERWRAPSRRQGFVSGGMLHDFDGDGDRDAVVSNFEGRLLRIDGASGRRIWHVRNATCESYSTPSLGRFEDDARMDVLAVFSEGHWPAYETRTRLQWVDGDTGEILREREQGVQCSASPLVADFDGDGRDETVVLTNLSFSQDREGVTSRLVVYDGRREKRPVLQRDFSGFAAATPWLGDMDADGQLDLVLATFNQVVRLTLDHPKASRVSWNQYRGPLQDGVVPRRTDTPPAPPRAQPVETSVHPDSVLARERVKSTPEEPKGQGKKKRGARAVTAKRDR